MPKHKATAPARRARGGDRARSPRQALAQALDHHRAGRLKEAEAIYRDVLAREPRNMDALHLQGMLAWQAGRPEEALQNIGEAIRIDSSVAMFHNSLGTVLYSLGQLQEAVRSFEAALRLAPDNREARQNLAGSLVNRGVALHSEGRLDEAAACYREALRLRPDLAEAHFNLGNAHKAQARFEEAVAAYHLALRFKPGWAEAFSNLAVAFIGLRRFEEAESCCRKALRLNPQLPEAHNALGNALEAQQKLEEAAACYREALRLEPDFPEAHSNLGATLVGMGSVEEGVRSLREALRLKPELAVAHNNLGHALEVEGRSEEALACYAEALRLRPDYLEALNNRGNALARSGFLEAAMTSYWQALALDPAYPGALNNLGFTLQALGEVERAIAFYRRALASQPAFSLARSNLLFALNCDRSADPAAVFAEHQRWAELHALPLAAAVPPHLNDRNPERRLRIGYLSPDFRLHPVAFFIEPILAAHDRESFEVICYANVSKPDDVTSRLRPLAGGWRNIFGQTDARVAELVRLDQIDVLVDLAGHTANGRLLVFARQPAPVQVSYLGYPNTTGVPAIEYRLTDRWADPPGRTEHLHTEQLVRLPNGFLCFKPPADAPPPGPVPAIQKGALTFGSFHNLAKVTPEVIAVWSAVLQAVPASRLLMKTGVLSGEGARRRIRDLFACCGIGGDRLELLGRAPTLAAHLDVYSQLDIALDTFPYNGATTTCEALWMGVPVITLAGQTHVSRVGFSLLSNLGLGEFIADSPEAYIERAAGLARDLDRLAELRSALRNRMLESPLTDAAGFTRTLEAAYRWMWRRWCERRH